jgi:chromosome partitioning protein
MQTIIFNSQKGGSGKTSLCAHVAVEAENSGDGPVYLIDADPGRAFRGAKDAR